ncbi:MAG: adenylate/guanylate cyclase domain-containing protein, partial [Methanosarcinales archaeon]
MVRRLSARLRKCCCSLFGRNADAGPADRVPSGTMLGDNGTAAGLIAQHEQMHVRGVDLLDRARATFSTVSLRFTDNPAVEADFVQQSVSQSRLPFRYATAFALLLRLTATLPYILGSRNTTGAVVTVSILIIANTFACAVTFTKAYVRFHKLIISAYILLTCSLAVFFLDVEVPTSLTTVTLLLFGVLRIQFLVSLLLGITNALVAVAVVFTNRNTVMQSLFGPYIVYYLFFLVFVLAGSYSIQAAMRSDYVQRARLLVEEARGNDFLANMLPYHIVTALRKAHKRQTTSVSFSEPSVSILFIDIVDFHRMVEAYTPIMLVQQLDSFFSLVDVLAEKHCVMKYEHVGRSYVLVSGLQGDRKDHTTALALLGLDLLQHLARLHTSDGQQVLRVRMGLHTGPVLSGLVGRKRPQFVLVGDTINTASRMVSSGTDDCIHASPEAGRALMAQFELQPQHVYVKSKGWMDTFIVLRIAPISSLPPVPRQRGSILA